MTIQSATLQGVKPSPTIGMTQLARDLASEGRDILALTAGEPDFPTPSHVCDAAKAAIDAGFTKYPHVDGIPGLKEAIVSKFARDNGLSFDPSQVTVGTGGKQVLFNALKATVDEGDEVLIPVPYWVSYPDMVRLCGGTPVFVPADIESGFKLTPRALEAAITPRSKWLMFNSPSNPSGAAYTRAEMEALMDVVRRHPQLWVLSDDIYEAIVFDGLEFVTPAQVAPDLADRILTMNGVSKGHAMTGWRIGYGAGPKPLIEAMRKVLSQTTSGACSIAQHAAVAALDGPQDHVAKQLVAFQARRDRVVAALNSAPGVTCPMPDGAFYVFPSIAGCIGKRSPGGALIATDEDFAMALLREEGVGSVFGSAFGLSPHIRLSYAAADDVLTEACARFVRFCERLT